MILDRLIEMNLLLLFLRGKLVGLVIRISLDCEILSNIIALLYSLNNLREVRPKSRLYPQHLGQDAYQVAAVLLPDFGQEML